MKDEGFEKSKVTCIQYICGLVFSSEFGIIILFMKLCYVMPVTSLNINREENFLLVQKVEIFEFIKIK